MQAGYSSLQEQAKKLHESCQLEEALPLYHKLYSSAISSNSLTSELLDDYADLCSSLGDLDFSIKLYTQSIQLFPTVNPSKYFSYAQLVCGQESVEMYLKGIAMCGETEKSQIAAAYSALIEIYMTDLCDHPQAENNCEEYIRKAIETDELCMDAYLALSNLRLIRARIPEAKEALQKLKIVIENCGTENFPSCDFLSQACKNAIECEDFEILEFFTEVGLSIDESNTELSYLRGFALAKLGFKDEALDTLNQLLAKNISPELKEAAEEIILTLD